MSFYPSEKDNKKYTIGATILGLIALGLIIYFEYEFFNRYGIFFIFILFFAAVFFFFSFGKSGFSRGPKLDIVTDTIIKAADNEAAIKEKQRQSAAFLKGAIFTTLILIIVAFLPRIMSFTTTAFCNSHNLQIPDGCPQLAANIELAVAAQRLLIAIIAPLEIYLISNLIASSKNQKK